MTLPEPRIAHYQHWLHTQRGLQFADYDALWRWSVSDLEAFWRSIWDYFDMQSPTPYRGGAGRAAHARRALVPRRAGQLRAAGDAPCRCRRMPQATRRSSSPTRCCSRAASCARCRWPELRRQVGALAARAASAWACSAATASARYCPTSPQTIVVFLAVASLGAIWSHAARPTWGRWRCSTASARSSPRCWWPATATPTAATRTTGARWSTSCWRELPSVRHAVRGAPTPIRRAGAGRPRQAHDLAALLARRSASRPNRLPFDHPLWIVYSSGTTGLPKPIVHGHGGIMLEALKLARCTTTSGRASTPATASTGISSTGWIMWNCQVGALLRRHARSASTTAARAGREGARLAHAVALRRRWPACTLLRRRRGLLSPAA